MEPGGHNFNLLTHRCHRCGMTLMDVLATNPPTPCKPLRDPVALERYLESLQEELADTPVSIE